MFIVIVFHSFVVLKGLGLGESEGFIYGTVPDCAFSGLQVGAGLGK